MTQENNSINLAKKTANSDHKNLIEITQYIKNGQPGHKKTIPPLEKWHPKHCGSMDLHIKANGEWWHEGQLIKRQALIDLFASVLWKEEHKFYLKTPVEQIEIQVEDEPLFVNQVQQIKINDQSYIQLGTTTGDEILVDEAHAIFMREFQGEMRPYVHVRFGLNALIQRASFFHLIELGQLEENAEETILLLQSGDFCLQLKA